MRKKLIAANWKMNGDGKFAQAYIHAMNQAVPQLSSDIEIAIFPSFVHLSIFAQELKTPLSFGAQNVSEYESGAYTGEVSVSMLKELGCRYVIVGHSERRALFHEDNQTVARKYKIVQAHGLKPILCVGETLEQREQGLAEQTIVKQLAAVVAECGDGVFEQAVIAYEPVWAIGTGKTATPEQAQEIHSIIRNYVAELQPEMAKTIQIIYGGSVKADNAQALFAMQDIDGALVGGASLQAEQFILIAQSF